MLDIARQIARGIAAYTDTLIAFLSVLIAAVYIAINNPYPKTAPRVFANKSSMSNKPLLVMLWNNSIAKVKAEAFEQMKQGNFNGGVFEMRSPKNVTILSCELEYRVDTKGFYQPVYMFKVMYDGVEDQLKIMIPAL